MKKVENNLLTPNQFSKLLIFGMITIGIVNIPNEMVKYAKQDGWISVMLGVIYPLYVIICALYIARNYPNENVLVLNKKFFGKVIGTVLNICQLFIHIFYTVSEVSGLSNFLRVYITDFISGFRLMFICIVVAAFCSYRGLTAIGRVSEIVFYNLILIGAIAILALTKGSILNVMPVFGSGWMNILRGMKGGIYSYAGMEIVLFIYPYLQDKNKLKSACLKCAGIICFAYTWVTFITIFYLSPSIIPKTIWSSLYIIESLRLPIINNFRFVMMFLWIFVSNTAIAFNYHICDIVMKESFKSLQRKMFYLFSIPIILCLSMLLGEEIKRREFINYTMLFVLIFNAIYILLMVFTVYLKRGKAYE
jgi:spore germination protein (amino acid permease)